MADYLDPRLLSAEGERMEKVLRLLEGFIHRPNGPLRLRPSSVIEGGAIPKSPNDGGEAEPTTKE